MDGRLNRRNKAAFSNSSGVVLACACENSRPSSLPARPSRETPLELGPGAKKDGCFRRLATCGPPGGTSHMKGWGSSLEILR